MDLFDKRFYSMRFPPREPRLMLGCFLEWDTRSFGPSNQNIPQQLCLVLNICLSPPRLLAVNQTRSRFSGPGLALRSALSVTRVGAGTLQHSGNHKTLAYRELIKELTNLFSHSGVPVSAVSWFSIRLLLTQFGLNSSFLA